MIILGGIFFARKREKVFLFGVFVLFGGVFVLFGSVFVFRALARKYFVGFFILPR